MENDEDDDWNDETEIDTELWMNALLAMTGEPEQKAALIRTIAQNTHQAPEEVEKIIVATLDFMMEKKAKPKLN